jgi:hypothetical protein
MMEGFTYDEPWPESTNEFRLFEQQTVKHHRLSHQSRGSSTVLGMTLGRNFPFTNYPSGVSIRP